MAVQLKDVYKFCYKCGNSLNTTDYGSLKCTNCGNEIFIDPTIGAMGIIENEKGEILMIQRGKDPFKGTWDVPAGFIDIKDQNAEETVAREAKEEVGVDIEKIRYLASYMHTYEYNEVEKPHMSLVFTAKLKSGEIKIDPVEIADAKFIAKSEIPFEDIGFPHVKLALEKYIKE